MSKVTVDIHVEYGSKFQEDNFIRILRVFLNALKMYMEQSHSKNLISYTVNTHDGYKVSKK